MPNGQHMRLLIHQLLLSSAFLPFPYVSHAFFSPVMHAHSFSLIFSYHCKRCLCGGGVGGVFASHMAVPGASGADVLDIGALLHQAHAYTCTCSHARTHRHTHTHTHTEEHKHGGLCSASYRGRGHWLTTVLSNSSTAGYKTDKRYSKEPLSFKWVHHRL